MVSPPGPPVRCQKNVILSEAKDLFHLKDAEHREFSRQIPWSLRTTCTRRKLLFAQKRKVNRSAGTESRARVIPPSENVS
jgi:hypothetical protein